MSSWNPIPATRSPYSQQLARWFGAAVSIWISLLAVMLAPAALATSVLQAPLRETVRQADAIVVGTVVSSQSRWGDASRRWMRTDYVLAVEDVILEAPQGAGIGKTIVLTYWGGTIGDETQSVADVRTPATGERIVAMLHSRWAERNTIAPTVGFNQGFFTVVPDGVGGTRVRDADGQPVTVAPNGQLMRGSAGAGAAGVDLAAFSSWLRANLPSIKREPPPKASKLDPADPRLLATFAKTPVMPIAKPDASPLALSMVPAQSPAPETTAGVPAVPSEVRYGLATELARPESLRSSATRTTPKYATSHQAHPPIVVNSYPASFAPWYPEDQYQMSKWNYYATNIFRVYTTPTGTYAWPDGVFDLAGWPSEADLVRVYGSSWYCGAGCVTYGVTFRRFDGGGWIIEADIALNPSVGWTLDDEWIYDGSAAIGFRQTFIHELGHMHGLDHNFGFVALMNYFQPSEYRFYAMPFADDAGGIRFEYPSAAVPVTDLAVYLFYETGVCYDGTTYFNCISQSSFPANVNAGSSFVVNNYHVENPGTTTIATPTIEWYLTSARNYSSSYYYLGTTTYSALTSFSYFTPSTVARTLSVPSNVPAGNYYLAAYISADGGPGQGSFPFSNNYAFSRTRMFVKGASTTGLTSSANPSVSGALVTFTATVSGTSPSGTVSFTEGGVALAGCGAKALASGKATCATSALSVGSHPIVATYAGDANNNGSASVTLNQIVQAPPSAGRRRDFNGDGKSDLVWRSTGGSTALWLMNGTVPSSTGVVMGDPNWLVTHTGDLSGDGKADLVWRNSSTGQTAAWLMNGIAAASAGALMGDPNWSVQNVGDFNGDGKKDLVWRNTSTGATSIWLMNGLAPSSSGIVLGDANWSVALVGDFNGDGKEDLVWRNASTGQTAIWLMNGLASASSAVIYADPNWVPTHAADFNGDGKADLVWRNASTGQTAIWLMNGTALTSGTIVLTDPNWTPTHTADLNGDGKADLVWRNAATGQTAVWLMNGTAPSSSGVILSLAQWSVVGTGDTNGDGKADLAWRNSATGEHAVWIMNGLAPSASAMLSGDPAWLVANPGGTP
ncbi:MAG: FG-GAP-like repeat-containing protein [Burkholderiales bacterium]